MEAIEAILTRQSVRHFVPTSVPQEEINIILKAAMQAPSAVNTQSWQFIVITDRAILEEITRFHSFAGALKEAPLAILVCGDARDEVGTGRWIQNCSAATQNILLAAHARGLEAVWLGIHPEEQRIEGMRSLLNLPDVVMPLSLVAIGYPANELKNP